MYQPAPIHTYIYIMIAHQMSRRTLNGAASAIKRTFSLQLM